MTLGSAIEDDIRLIRELRSLMPIVLKSTSRVSSIAMHVRANWERLRIAFNILNAFTGIKHSTSASASEQTSSVTTLNAIAVLLHAQPISVSGGSGGSAGSAAGTLSLDFVCSLSSLAGTVMRQVQELRDAIRYDLSHSKDGTAVCQCIRVNCADFCFFLFVCSFVQNCILRLFSIHWKNPIVTLNL
jgi:hypothetical protein